MMEKFSIHTTPIKGLYIVDTNAFVDQRGAFARWFCENELKSIIDENSSSIEDIYIENVTKITNPGFKKIYRFYSKYIYCYKIRC